jgi:hypothetical protein
MKEDQGVAPLLCCLVNNSFCVMIHELVINKNSLRRYSEHLELSKPPLHSIVRCNRDVQVSVRCKLSFKILKLFALVPMLFTVEAFFRAKRASLNSQRADFTSNFEGTNLLVCARESKNKNGNCSLMAFQLKR